MVDQAGIMVDEADIMVDDYFIRVTRELINVSLLSVHTKDSGVKYFHILHQPTQMM